MENKNIIIKSKNLKDLIKIIKSLPKSKRKLNISRNIDEIVYGIKR